jgi:hypothetical protein
MWIRKDNAFEGIIDPSLFQKAQEMIAIRAGALTDEEMLDRLRHCRRKHGTLSSKLIKSSLVYRVPYATRLAASWKHTDELDFCLAKV